MTGLSAASVSRVSGGLAHDVPDEQLVIAAHGGVGVVVHADRALEPPVGGVQAVRVMTAGRRQARRRQLRGELGAGEDADVAAGHLVVLGGQRPADPLGQPGGHGHRDDAAGAEHAGDLGQGGGVVRHVLEDLGDDDGIEKAVGKGQPRRVGGDRGRLRGRAGLALRAHRGEHVADPREFLEVEIGGDDAGAAAVRLERVAACAAAEVENAVTWIDRKFREIDR